MMDITIKGGSKTQRELIAEIADFVGPLVLGPRMARAVSIDYIIKRKLDADGWCEWMDDNLRPREFKIEVRAEQTYLDLILTICHEMVHVRQMAKRELYEIFSPKQMRVWKGKRLKKEIPYSKQPWEPWEAEAYKLQSVLAKKFVEETGFVYTAAMQKRDEKYAG